MAAFRYLLCISLLSSCLAAKFVVFPMFSRSHYLVLAKLGEELAQRGHEVQIFVGDTETFAFKSPIVRQFKTPALFKTSMKSTGSKLASGSLGGNVIDEMELLAFLQAIYCDAILGNADILREVNNADLVVGDSMFACSSLIAEKFSLPHATVFPLTISSPAAHAFGMPLPPAYVPQFKSALTDKMTFVERVKNVYHWFLVYRAFHSRIVPTVEELKKQYNISPSKSLVEILMQVDLVIGQTGLFLEYPRSLLPNTKVVGPFLPSPAKPLPNDLEMFAQSSEDSGLIVVAFGTILGKLDKAIVSLMADAFAKLPQKVIWKLSEEESKMSFSDNIKVVSWMPQNDILGHPKTRLFIGHAGLNGMFEAAYHGVPIICSPFFSDQFDNAQTAKSAGFSETVELKKMTTLEFVNVIRTVLTEPRYRESAVRLSKAIKLLPRTPVQEAADWVEYTQAQGGLPHLRPRGLDLPFYQLYLLDVLLVALLVLVVAFFVARFLLKALFRCLFGSSKKEKTN